MEGKPNLRKNSKSLYTSRNFNSELRDDNKRLSDDIPIIESEGNLLNKFSGNKSISRSKGNSNKDLLILNNNQYQTTSVDSNRHLFKDKVNEKDLNYHELNL